ncbi:histidine phosphatase family protein [Frankia sp. CiP3]|uniref:histidine phosphatase family protein n=1 Tax=Frankia sp. CiP3 TaxID=2880971 RepID=UPI001EF5F74D|nr:histidine phosphatase family protein [Frankia sp. CiP3]
MTGPGAGLPRLTLISHAPTAATRAARFPSDEGVDAGELRRFAVAGVRRADLVLCDTSLRTRQTADALGLACATADPALRDLDMGDWRGRALAEIPAADLEAWVGDPAQAPHGGESVAELIGRVGRWLARGARVSGHTIAVTHPAVIRAALVAVLRSPAEVFWRIDVPPLSTTFLHGRAGDAWNLRHACLPITEEMTATGALDEREASAAVTPTTA